MKRMTIMMMGLAVAMTVSLASLVQGADKPAGPPKAEVKQVCPAECPGYGQCDGKGRQGKGWGGGMGMGQQKRYGWSQGQGPGNGKGFRGGPRDGSGPRRDGSCGRCWLNEN